MPPLQLADLPGGIPIPYRSAEAPDGLDLTRLLIAHPLSTFYMRVRSHRFRRWGVLDGDLLLIDRSIEPRPGHLVVVAHGESFLLRPLSPVAWGFWLIQQRTDWPRARRGSQRSAGPLELVAL